MIIGQDLVLMSNNATVVTYLKKQGRTVSLDIYRLAQDMVGWLDLHMVSISARCILRNKNILACQLSHLDQVIPTDWSILPWVFDDACKVFGHPHLSLFATRANTKLPIRVYPVSVPIVWKQDAF